MDERVYLSACRGQEFIRLNFKFKLDSFDRGTSLHLRPSSRKNLVGYPKRSYIIWRTGTFRRNKNLRRTFRYICIHFSKPFLVVWISNRIIASALDTIIKCRAFVRGAGPALTNRRGWTGNEIGPKF